MLQDYNRAMKSYDATIGLIETNRRESEKTDKNCQQFWSAPFRATANSKRCHFVVPTQSSLFIICYTPHLENFEFMLK